MDQDIHVLTDWQTPVTKYPKKTNGKVVLDKEMREGDDEHSYFAEGVKGIVYYRFAKTVPITTLSIDGKMWMNDEPTYVWCLKSFAERSTGHVLVAGLGLGIVLHYLVDNPRVKTITVVEREREVIDLMDDLVPNDARLSILHDDFYQFLHDDGVKRNTLIWDLGVWNEESGDDAPGKKEILMVRPMAQARYGMSCRVFVHGLDRDPVGEKFVSDNADAMRVLKRRLREEGGDR